jgi:hypothetical protein
MTTPRARIGTRVPGGRPPGTAAGPGLGSLVLLLLAGGLLAQASPRVAQGYRLDDGTRVEGTWQRGELRTCFGTLAAAVEPARIDLDRDRALFSERLQDTAPEFLAGLAGLARWGLGRGLYEDSRRVLAGVLHRDPDQPIARACVRDLARRFRLDPAEEGTRTRDRTALARALFGTWARRGALEAALALEKVPLLPEDRQVREALDGLKAADAPVRWLSAQVLGRHQAPVERIPPLYRRSLLDESAHVRRAAVRALRATGDPAFVRLYAKNLRHPQATVRVRAIEALGEFGAREALPHLLEALADTWRPTRNFIQVTTQRAYVKDFDVEVAASAVIADPVVDVVQEGAVLDVAVIQVDIERTIIARALARIVGHDFGPDPAAWPRR